MDVTDTKSSPVWDDRLLAHPHEVADKRQRVQRMFAAIAPSYDLNNRLHSLWMDQRWRRKAVKLARLKPTDVIVDVACGTGDLTLLFAKHLDMALMRDLNRWSDEVKTGRIPESDLKRMEVDIPGAKGPLIYPNSAVYRDRPSVIGVDFTFQMLPIARRKAPDESYKPRVRFLNGDALALPLTDASADVVSIAFGIRNVADAAAAMREFYRVLRPGGRLIILEFSLPTNRVLRGLYNFYFRKVLPRTATWISRDRTGAYKYLPESVNTFITRERMGEMMTAAGFARVEQFPMTFGVCVCYRGVKR